MNLRPQPNHFILAAVIALTVAVAVLLSTSDLTVPWSVQLTVPHGGYDAAALGHDQHRQQNREEVNTMRIDLTERELPAKGPQEGVFADVVQGVKSDRRKKAFRTLTLVAQLAALKSNQQRFTAVATYNLDDNRGVKHLIEDLKVWRNSQAIPDLSQFDPEAEFIGKPFVCDPTFAEEGGKKVIRLSGYRPAPESKLAVSSDFVRAKDQTQAATAASASAQGAAPKPAQQPATA
jgi:hypothetical protein